MEELKMIIELASKITDGAFYVVITYFVMDFISLLLMWAGWITLAVIFTKLMIKLTCNYSILNQLEVEELLEFIKRYKIEKEFVEKNRGFDDSN